MKPDSNFILSITPNYAYGRRQGLTDEETEKLAEEAYSLMQIAEEKQVPKKPVDTYNEPPLVLNYCPTCYNSLTDGYGWEYNYCPECAQKIDWGNE